MAGVVVLAGAFKWVRPGPAADLLRALGVHGSTMGARGVGLAEMIIGAGALAFGGPFFAAAIGALYLAFAAIVLIARRRDDVESCGCFGAATTPPSLVHVGVNVASAAIAFTAAAISVEGLPDILDDQPALGLPYLALVLLGVYLVHATDTVLPEVFDAMRSVVRTAPSEPAR